MNLFLITPNISLQYRECVCVLMELHIKNPDSHDNMIEKYHFVVIFVSRT